MKTTIKQCLVIMLLIFFVQNTKSKSIKNEVSKPTTEVRSKQESSTLVVRLNEINKMDKSNLSSSDKRHLRKEVRGIKQQLKASNGGVYISGGAIIIILILLIILL
jgi:biopolymer transport protein ExbD